MDFSKFEVVTRKNKKKEGSYKKGQNFRVKYRRFTLNGKQEDKVIISDKLWDELGLESNGMVQIYDKNEKTLGLCVVPNEHANILKTHENVKKKGRSFKSSEFTDRLIEAGLIDGEAKYDDGGSNQFLDIEPISLDNAPDYFIATFKVVIGEKLTGSAKTAVDSEAPNETEPVDGDAIAEGDVPSPEPIQEDDTTIEETPDVEGDSGDSDNGEYLEFN